ncbi:hypothetical protein DFQ30_008738 [Apophysomyces sp. BC1015]|nr:hypothetical protein DFQ30_008738 [Apophysomyces sp. BC1015]KAG0171688.1 hypothetical protein DFQ29_008709 [Apophysomyces sp. BC1021]
MVIPLFSEQLGNINVIRATIAVDASRSVDTELVAKDNCLFLGRDKVIDFSTVGLDIDTSKLTFSPHENEKQKGFWDIKLVMKQSSYEPPSEPQQWWPARDLEGCRGLQCRHCSADLVESLESFKRKDLPSEHWYELVECWICHETKPEEHRARMRPISARSNMLLVGMTYFLVHPTDIGSGAVSLDNEMAARIDWDKGMSTRWVSVTCSKCNGPLGEAQCERQDSQVVMFAVKLFKYCVTVVSSLHLQQPTFIDFLVHDLIDAAKAHATYRFLIQGKQSSRIYALIWLFNWNTHIIYNRGFEEADSNSNNTPDIFRERGQMDRRDFLNASNISE